MERDFDLHESLHDFSHRAAIPIECLTSMGRCMGRPFPWGTESHRPKIEGKYIPTGSSLPMMYHGSWKAWVFGTGRPFLFEPNGLLCYMLELTGRDVTNSIQAFLATLADTLVQYLTIESPKRISNTEVQRDLSNYQGGGKLYVIVAMLANDFNENVIKIVRVIEVC